MTKTLLYYSIIGLFLLLISSNIFAQPTKKAVPVFENGEAQIVPEFEDSERWIRHDL